MNKKIAIVGGGISGLTLAYQLQKKFSDISLFEAGAHLGGVIRTEQENDLVFEMGPDCFLTQKKDVLDLADELGIADRVIPTKAEFRKSFILKNNTLIETPDGLYLMAPMNFRAFLFSPLLSLKGKLRAGLDLILPRSGSDQEESLASFVTRRLGKETLDRIAQPMISGIYGADPAFLSLNASLPRFIELEKKYRSVILGLRKERNLMPKTGNSGPRYSLFMSFIHGMSELPQALERKLTCQIEKNTPIIQVQKQNGGFRLLTSQGRWVEADILALCISATASAKLLENDFPELSTPLRSISYGSLGIVNLVFETGDLPQLVPATGFVIPKVENKRIIACTIMNQKFDHRAPKHQTLLRVFLGGELHPTILNYSNSELVNIATTEIQTIFKTKATPTHSRVSRWEKAMPQYNLGHLSKVKQIQKTSGEIPNLHLLGNGLEGVGIPDMIKNATQTAQKIFSA